MKGTGLAIEPTQQRSLPLTWSPPPNSAARALGFAEEAVKKMGALHGGSRATKEVQRRGKKLYKANFVRPADPGVLCQREV